MAGLTPQQLLQLVQPVAAWRVNQEGGHSHLEGYDVRAHLLRIFGIGNSDVEVIGSWHVGSRQRTIPAVEEPDGAVIPEHDVVTVAYRSRVRLTVRDLEGGPVGTWAAEAVGSETEAAHLWPAAHHNAVTTAETLALRRCAINLGDQFGLGLYGRNPSKPIVDPRLWAHLLPEGTAPFESIEQGMDPVQRERGEAPLPPEEQVWIDRMLEAQARLESDPGKYGGDPGVAYNEARMGKAAPATMTKLREILEGRA